MGPLASSVFVTLSLISIDYKTLTGTYMTVTIVQKLACVPVPFPVAIFNLLIVYLVIFCETSDTPTFLSES